MKVSYKYFVFGFFPLFVFNFFSWFRVVGLQAYRLSREYENSLLRRIGLLASSNTLPNGKNLHSKNFSLSQFKLTDDTYTILISINFDIVQLTRNNFPVREYSYPIVISSPISVNPALCLRHTWANTQGIHRQSIISTKVSNSLLVQAAQTDRSVSYFKFGHVVLP